MPASAELLREVWPVLVAYVVGATPFGYLAGKLRGIDIRQHGSGNIGATNVLRVLGKPVGIAVLILDMLKGLLPVLLAQAISDSSAIHIATSIAAMSSFSVVPNSAAKCPMFPPRDAAPPARPPPRR